MAQFLSLFWIAKPVYNSQMENSIVNNLLELYAKVNAMYICKHMTQKKRKSILL